MKLKRLQRDKPDDLEKSVTLKPFDIKESQDNIEAKPSDNTVLIHKPEKKSRENDLRDIKKSNKDKPTVDEDDVQTKTFKSGIGKKTGILKIICLIDTNLILLGIE